MKSLIQIFTAAFIATGLLFCVQDLRADSSTSYTIYLATTDSDGNLSRAGEQPEFNCSDVVYLVVESDGPQQDEMSAYWIDPAGKEQVRASRVFEKGHARWWAWSGLKLNKPAGGGLFGMFDPSHGLEAFIGQWQVHVDVGPHRMTSITFSVLC